MGVMLESLLSVRMCFKVREGNGGAHTVVLGVGRGVARLFPAPAGVNSGGGRFGEVPELGDSVPCTLTPLPHSPQVKSATYR